MSGKESRISRLKHEDVLDRMEQRLVRGPQKMNTRRETIEHRCGTIKMWVGATHFQMMMLKHVGREMSLHVLAYNIKRVMNTKGVESLRAALSDFLLRLCLYVKQLGSAIAH
jgi:hypothetical protein